MSNNFVLYHADCMDGLGAKYAAWKKFGNDATYIPVEYKKPVPEIPDGSNVYIVDFSYPRDELEALRKRCLSLVVRDHHKTAEEALKGLDYAFFDMNKSGAVLAWEYFHPKVPVPKLLLHIQDRDLWQWKLSDTREILNLLGLEKEDFEAWECLEKELEPTNSNLWLTLTLGRTISNYEDNYIEQRCEKARLGTYLGFRVAIYNTTLLGSEIGSKLCEAKEIDFSIGYFIKPEGKVSLSFRSIGDFDVTPFAKGLGGGGHKNASGAIVDLDFLRVLYG